MIDDTSIRDAFLAMLTFIKTNMLPEPMYYNDVKILELLAVAYRYDVKDLKVICERYLIINIDFTNAVKYLNVAIKFEAKILEEHAIAFIKYHLNELMDTEEFEKLPRSDLRRLMKSLMECKSNTTCQPNFAHSKST